MNENTENSGNDFFYDLLDNPADLSHSNAFNLQLLINDYPQSSLLRSMLAVKRDEESIRKASAYVNPKLLYKIANSVNSLRTVADEQIIFSDQPRSGEVVLSTTGAVEIPNLGNDESNYFHVPVDNDLAYFEEQETEQVIADDEQQPEETEITELAWDVEETQEEELPPPVPDEQPEESEFIEVDETPELNNVAETSSQEEVTDGDVAVDETLPVYAEQADEAEPEITTLEEEITQESEEKVDTEATLAREYEEYMSRTNEASAINDIGEKPVHPHQEIEDEVFEEIVSIEDIGLEQLALMDKAAEELEGEVVQHQAEQVQEPDIEHSYEVFEPTLPEDEEHKLTPNITPQYATTGRKAGERLARYNDEKMPYSFMWWLDKTRKEHADVYQPFVDGKAKNQAARPVEKPQPAADHLQQQYMANILTVSSVVSELNLTPPKVDTPPPPVDVKADKIIERFIQEEPQIKHPAKAKLDNENKAKKSSEDRDELVTETLAKIYTEQMLYHKAILTYKKLMLKFPEKSLYFAGQIEQLEKKIN